MSLRDEDRLLRRTQAQTQSSGHPSPAAVGHAPTPGSGRSRRLQENRGGAPAKQRTAAGSPARVQCPPASLLGHWAQPQGQLPAHQAVSCAAPHVVPSGGRRRGIERGASAPQQVWDLEF